MSGNPLPRKMGSSSGHGDGPQNVAHAPLAYHAARQVRSLLQVVLRPCGSLVQHEAFRGVATHGYGDAVRQPSPVARVRVIFREGKGNA